MFVTKGLTFTSSCWVKDGAIKVVVCVVTAKGYWTVGAVNLDLVILLKSDWLTNCVIEL